MPILFCSVAKKTPPIASLAFLGATASKGGRTSSDLIVVDAVAVSRVRLGRSGEHHHRRLHLLSRTNYLQGSSSNQDVVVVKRKARSALEKHMPRKEVILWDRPSASESGNVGKYPLLKATVAVCFLWFFLGSPGASIRRFWGPRCRRVFRLFASLDDRGDSWQCHGISTRKMGSSEDYRLLPRPKEILFVDMAEDEDYACVRESKRR